MDPIHIKSKTGPEAKIQAAFVEYLEARHWHVTRMIGNVYQKGIPDLYIQHQRHGDRWVDLKFAGAYEFTMAQRLTWPVWAAHGTGIWIITGNDDYYKLFEPPNWELYWKEKYNNTPTRAELIKVLENEN